MKRRRKVTVHEIIDIIVYYLLFSAIFMTIAFLSSNRSQQVEKTSFQSIEAHPDLMYNVDTKVIYTPYISEDGNYYQYIDGEITEITTN